jgi:nitrogen fixation/metabolism regulation signal transduction histidine kinase
MTTSAPAAGAAPNKTRYKRSFKNYLIDSRFQLKYTGLILLIAVAISGVLGVFLWRTSGEVVMESQKVVEQSRQVVEQSKKVSDVVKMSIRDDPVYGENPELADTFNAAAVEQDNKIVAQQDAAIGQQAALVRQQRTMLYALVGALAVMVFLIGVLGIYFTHKVAGPVYKMKILLRQVAEGKLHVAARLRKGDELQDFFDVFARMVDNLRSRQMQEIEQLEAAIATARSSGVSDEAIAKVLALRDRMKRSLET